MSLGELVGEGRDIRLNDSGTELRGREGDVFAIVNLMEFKVMTLKFVAWIDNPQAHGTDSPGARGTPKGGRYDRYSVGRNGN